MKVHAFSGLWSHIQRRAIEALEKRSAFRNVSKAYAKAVKEYAKPETLNGLAGVQLSHPTDTHPPLGLRLESLEISASDVEMDALNITPAYTPIALVPEAEKLEEEISDEYQTSS